MGDVPSREDDIAEAEAYADGGLALSRKTAGRLAIVAKASADMADWTGWVDAERIVRQLAASNEPVADLEPEYGDVVCMTCPEDSERFDRFADVTHAEDCAWRRARAWVAEHPVGEQE